MDRQTRARPADPLPTSLTDKWALLLVLKLLERDGMNEESSEPTARSSDP